MLRHGACWSTGRDMWARGGGGGNLEQCCHEGLVALVQGGIHLVQHHHGRPGGRRLPRLGGPVLHLRASRVPLLACGKSSSVRWRTKSQPLCQGGKLDLLQTGPGAFEQHMLASARPADLQAEA